MTIEVREWTPTDAARTALYLARTSRPGDWVVEDVRPLGIRRFRVRLTCRNVNRPA